MAIVDTHAHIYSEDTETYPQSPEPFLPPSGRGTIADLKNEVKANSIDRVVIVQTFTVYQHDNRLTMDTVRDNQEWTTGVLNLNPFDRWIGKSHGGGTWNRCPWKSGFRRLANG